MRGDQWHHEQVAVLFERRADPSHHPDRDWLLVTTGTTLGVGRHTGKLTLFSWIEHRAEADPERIVMRQTRWTHVDPDRIEAITEMGVDDLIDHVLDRAARALDKARTRMDDMAARYRALTFLKAARLGM